MCLEKVVVLVLVGNNIPPGATNRLNAEKLGFMLVGLEDQLNSVEIAITFRYSE
jgi:hypothetical protein